MREIADQSHRAADIIRSLRDLVAKSDPRRSPMQLNDVVQEVRTLTESQFENSGVELCFELEEVPEILGDRIQLEQVLINLLQNSLDAVLEANHEPRRIVVNTATNGDELVRLSVRDTGTGLGRTSAERVFDRFYSSKPKGMGMGLAISRSIIEAHGGRLWGRAQR